MRKIIYLSLGLVLLSTPAAAKLETLKQAQSIHAEPEGDMLVVLPQGTLYQILETKAGWIKISVEGYMRLAAGAASATTYKSIPGFKNFKLYPDADQGKPIEAVIKYAGLIRDFKGVFIWAEDPQGLVAAFYVKDEDIKRKLLKSDLQQGVSLRLKGIYTGVNDLSILTFDLKDYAVLGAGGTDGVKLP